MKRLVGNAHGGQGVGFARGRLGSLRYSRWSRLLRWLNSQVYRCKATGVAYSTQNIFDAISISERSRFSKSESVHPVSNRRQLVYESHRDRSHSAAGPTVGAAGTSGPVDGRLGEFGRRDAAQRQFTRLSADGRKEEPPLDEKAVYTSYTLFFPENCRQIPTSPPPAL